MKHIKNICKAVKIIHWCRIVTKKLPICFKYYAIAYWSDTNTFSVSFKVNDRLINILDMSGIHSWLDLLESISKKYERYYYEKSITIE